MEFLFSNMPPLRTPFPSFCDKFCELFKCSNALDIAVGYVTTDSLAELQGLMDKNDNMNQLQLIIGMHYFDKFTKPEYEASLELNKYLKNGNRGSVRLVTPFKFHGKMYSFRDNQGRFAGIMGSNNLSSIIDGGARTYESAVVLNDSGDAAQMSSFIKRLTVSSTSCLDELEITDFRPVNKLLEGQEGARKATAEEIAFASSCKGVSFEIPIKTDEEAPKSNLNAFFGKGRLSVSTGLIKPRHWYEVELIVPREITSQNGYPVSQSDDAIFDVITDDGWCFKCKVSGDCSKNFRSADDLKILGRWLKGRLENKGALKTGRPVTADTMQKYGRSTFTMKKTSKPGLWYLDFGVE